MRSRIPSSIAMAAAILACDRPRTSPDALPEPSASVITIGVGLGTCSDLSLCEAECDAGSADRCRRLAMTYAVGDHVDKDGARATELYQRACDLKDPTGCVFAGQMHEYAHGVPKDDTKAARLYERACDVGWTAGCYNLAIMFENGRGVLQDRERAATLYEAACNAGAKEACDRARSIRHTPFIDGGP